MCGSVSACPGDRRRCRLASPPRRSQNGPRRQPCPSVISSPAVTRGIRSHPAFVRMVSMRLQRVLGTPFASRGGRFIIHVLAMRSRPHAMPANTKVKWCRRSGPKNTHSAEDRPLGRSSGFRATRTRTSRIPRFSALLRGIAWDGEKSVDELMNSRPLPDPRNATSVAGNGKQSRIPEMPASRRRCSPEKNDPKRRNWTSPNSGLHVWNSGGFKNDV
jgi:hypothetical protein